MPSLETIARPRRNRISIAVPREYGSYSFQVILLPISSEDPVPVRSVVHAGSKKKTFVEALLSCPKLNEGEALDISRDSMDYGRDIVIFRRPHLARGQGRFARVGSNMRGCGAHG